MKLEKRKTIKKKPFFKSSFPWFLVFVGVVFLFFTGCQKKERHVFLPPKPLKVNFQLDVFEFYGVEILEKRKQAELAEELTKNINFFYNSLYFNPENFSFQSVNQILAEFFNEPALEDFKKKKTALFDLIKLKPYLRKILSGEGKVKTLSVYHDGKTSEIIGVAQVEVKAVYLLSDGKKVELSHSGDYVLKGMEGEFKVEEFKFREQVKTYEKPKKKE